MSNLDSLRLDSLFTKVFHFTHALFKICKFYSYTQVMLELTPRPLDIFFKCSESLKDMFWQWDRFNWVRPVHVSNSNSTDSKEISQHLERFIDLNFGMTEDCINSVMISSLKHSMPERSSSWNSVELDKIVVRCSRKGLCWLKWQFWRFRVLSFGQACGKSQTLAFLVSWNKNTAPGYISTVCHGKAFLKTYNKHQVLQYQHLSFQKC